MRIFITVLLLLIAVHLYAFPLRNLSLGDKFIFTNITIIKPIDTNFEEHKGKKIIFIWRYDKNLSRKLLPDFIKNCENKNIPCMSIDLSNISIEELIKLHGENRIIIAKANEEFGNKLGIFTLPVTIFLDENNRIINAIGYEGNYLYKVSKYIDFILGNITKEQYEKDIAKTEIISKKSFLPDINLAMRYLNEKRTPEALKIIEKINLNELNNDEKVKIAEVFVLMDKLNDAEKIIENIKNTHSEFLLGYIRYLEKRYDESIAILNKISTLYPDKKRINHLLGLIYYKKGNFDKSSLYFYESLGEEILK